jgi:hypothetical protein
MTHFVLGLLLALPGQHCGSSYVAARAYSYAPSYSYGYAAPVYQTKTYTQSYYTPYVKQVQLVAVEQPAYDYKLQLAGDYVRQEQKAADAAELARQVATLRQEITALRATPPAIATPQPVISQQVPVQPPAYLPSPSPQRAPELPSKAVPFKSQLPSGQYNALPPPEVNPLPGMAPQPPPVGGETAARAVSMLQTKCIKCHGGDQPKGDFRMFDQNGNFVAGPLDLVLIDHAIASQEMPPGRPLDDNEYAIVKAFVTEQKDAIAAAIKGGGRISQD